MCYILTHTQGSKEHKGYSETNCHYEHKRFLTFFPTNLKTDLKKLANLLLGRCPNAEL